MKKDNDILNELKKLSPELSKLKKLPQDEVPHQYFEALPEKIFSRIRKEDEKKPVWQVWLDNAFRPKLRIAYAIAAAVVLSLLIFNNPGEQATSLDVQLAEISDQELDNYVLANLNDFDDDWFTNNIITDDTDDLFFLDTDNETIEEYLINEMGDLEYDEVIL